ncbi:MAG: DUF4124 domain-containing protein, partial [Burkholderiales bacterium]
MFSARKAALYSHHMKRLFAFLAVALFAAAATAQQYKWIDQDGRVRYGDVPPPGV